MKLTIVAVGRAKRDAHASLFADYSGRLPWPVTLKEVEDRRGGSGEERRRREGEQLLQAIPADALAVALDQGGRALSSEELAERIGQWRDDGRREVAFVIGGADGLIPAVLKRADFLLSLGNMTWPHMLVRAMLCEQLFRASCIQSGHPYHRGRG